MSNAWTSLILALQSYLYGIGWILIALAGAILTIRAIDAYTGFNVKRELQAKNIPFAIVLGMLLLGITFGTLYLAAHL